jgi:hypothetical protein
MVSVEPLVRIPIDVSPTIKKRKEMNLSPKAGAETQELL